MPSPNGRRQINTGTSDLHRSLAGLKARMVDPGCIMTEEEDAVLLRYLEEKRAGTLVTHEALQQEMD